MSDSIITNPHDKFFKESFGRKDIVLSFLHEYLPQSITKKFKYNTLEIAKDSYIDKELVEHFSDILYKIKVGSKNVYLYLLFEHKSYLDERVGFQLLRNMVKIWERCIKQNKRIKKLPVILPMVIYHGSERWNSDFSLSSFFDTLPELRLYVPGFKMEVFDISHIPDEQIKGDILLQACLMLQKYIFNADLIEKVPDILGLFKTLSGKNTGIEYLEVMLRYMFASVEDKKREKLEKEVTKAIKAGEDFMPTIAEALVQEGIEKGKLEGKLEDAQKMIEKRMTNADIRDITGLSIKDIDMLRKSLKGK
jgi:predicted transposase/invertase (TIGR01784 family)